MDAATVKVMRKLYALDRPACRVYGRSDCVLVQAMTLYGHVYLLHVGPVTKLGRDAPAKQVGEAALAALAAYEEQPDVQPSRDQLQDCMVPLLDAAGVKSPRGFTLGSAMVSVERVGKRIAVVPFNAEATGAQVRVASLHVLCAPQPALVGERVIDLLAQQVAVNRYHREDERKHRDEIDGEKRAVIGGRKKQSRSPKRRGTSGRKRA